MAFIFHLYVRSKQESMTALVNDEIAKLLQLRRLPGRLNAVQASVLLGFHPIDVPVLIERKLLRPLGKPSRNAVKYFAARDVEQAAADPAWLGKATQTMYDHWQGRNKRSPKGGTSGQAD